MRNIIYRRGLGKETWSMCSVLIQGQEINHLKHFSSSSPSSLLVVLYLLLNIHFIHTGVLIRSTAMYALRPHFIVKEK